MPNMVRLMAAAAAVTAATIAPAADAKPSTTPIHRRAAPISQADANAIQGFEARLKDYLALHRKLEATLPKLSKEATPQDIDKNQRALGGLIKSERAGAKRGDFFTPGMQSIVRRMIDALLKGQGKAIENSIMDENPGVPALQINDRYPDKVPLSTMPPQVLETLPKLEEDLEYRFIGKKLVLLDTHAHIVVDMTENVLP